MQEYPRPSLSNVLSCCMYVVDSLLHMAGLGAAVVLTVYWPIHCIIFVVYPWLFPWYYSYPPQLSGSRLWVLGGFHSIMSIFLCSRGWEDSFHTNIVMIGLVKVFKKITANSTSGEIILNLEQICWGVKIFGSILLNTSDIKSNHHDLSWDHTNMLSL